MRKKLFSVLTVLSCSLFLITGCGKSNVRYMDGTYEGKSELYSNEDEEAAGNGYGVVTITIKDQKIADCTFETYDLDGVLKDENYGKEGEEISNRDYYNKAQKAVAACTEYAELLVQSGNIDQVDAISGATINYNQFQEAVDHALEQAKIKE